MQILFLGYVQRRESLPPPFSAVHQDSTIPPSKCINFRDCAHPPPSAPATSDAPFPLPLASCQFCLRMLFPAGSPFQFRPWPGFPLTRRAHGTEARPLSISHIMHKTRRPKLMAEMSRARSTQSRAVSPRDRIESRPFMTF